MDQLMKSYMAIMAERDAAIQERNMALVEKKKALADRDIAMLQRDAAVSERNSVMLERDDVITQLQYQSSSMSGNNVAHGLSENGMSRGEKHMLQQQQHMDLLPHLAEAAYNPREVPFSDTFPNSAAASETAKSRMAKRTKQKKAAPSKKSAKLPRKGKRGSKGLSKQVTTTISWNDEQDLGGGSEWKDNLGLNKANFDRAAIPVPVCSCTGKLQPCYKWGNGGWQSACCTTTISMFPLPHLGNKRRSRMGGRKMSGSVYTKLLSRLAAEGHDLSSPIDLKDNWAKHGTNRYITIK